MEKKVLKVLRLQLKGGWATPAPPVGPALGLHGVNIALFCRQFNERTKDNVGATMGVELTVYDDREKSFTFVVKQPAASWLLKKAANVHRASGRPNTEKVGRITQRQLTEIARIKMPDLNTEDLEAAKRTIAGTAKSMGIEIVDDDAIARRPRYSYGF